MYTDSLNSAMTATTTMEVLEVPSRNGIGYCMADWSEAPEMKQPRHHFAAAVLNAEIYVVDGQSVEAFTPPTRDQRRCGNKGAWCTRASLPQ